MDKKAAEKLKDGVCRDMKGEAANERERQRIIRMTEELNEFYTDVDGYVYWWPNREAQGHLAAYHLRWLADELDRRNKEWDKQVSDYFENQEKMNSKKQEQGVTGLIVAGAHKNARATVVGEGAKKGQLAVQFENGSRVVVDESSFRPDWLKPVYRLLESTECMEEDDEILGDDVCTWLPVGSAAPGCVDRRWAPTMQPVRRRTFSGTVKPGGLMWTRRAPEEAGLFLVELQGSHELVVVSVVRREEGSLNWSGYLGERGYQPGPCEISLNAQTLTTNFYRWSQIYKYPETQDA